MSVTSNVVSLEKLPVHGRLHGDVSPGGEWFTDYER
jgi:hypothetical protein